MDIYLVTHWEGGHLEVFRFVACCLYWMIYDLVLPACKGRFLFVHISRPTIYPTLILQFLSILLLP